MITASTHLSPCRPRLLPPPHRQRNCELVAARLVATRKISHAPGQPENLVDAPSAEPSPVYRFVDGLQAIRQRQMTAQVSPRNFAVGLPAAAGQALASTNANLGNRVGAVLLGTADAVGSVAAKTVTAPIDMLAPRPQATEKASVGEILQSEDEAKVN